MRLDAVSAYALHGLETLILKGLSDLRSMWVDPALGSTDGNVTHVTLILWLLVVFVPVFMVFRELLLVYGVI